MYAFFSDYVFVDKQL